MDCQIISRYVAGESACSLAREYGYAKQSVLAFLRKQNIIIRDARDVVRALPKSEIPGLIEQYLNGASLIKLHGQYRISTYTIAGILKRYNVGVRSVRESVDYAEVNLPMSGSEFFYYLGLMLADGWIYERKYSLVAGLGMKDKNVIEFIRDSFSPNRKVYYDGAIYRIIFPISAEYRDFLASWGCIKRKSLVLKPTKNLDNISPVHFYQMLIGIIEGDGSIAAKTKTIRIYSGSLEFCQYVIQKVGFGRIGISNRRNARNPHTSFFCIWTCKQARILSELLLASDIIKLDRKWHIAREWVQAHNLRIQRATDIILNCKSPASDYDFAKKYNMHTYSVRNIRYGRRWKWLRLELEMTRTH